MRAGALSVPIAALSPAPLCAWHRASAQSILVEQVDESMPVPGLSSTAHPLQSTCRHPAPLFHSLESGIAPPSLTRAMPHRFFSSPQSSPSPPNPISQRNCQGPHYPFFPQILLTLHGQPPSASFSTPPSCCCDNRAELRLCAKHPRSTLWAFSCLTHDNIVR